MKPPPAPLKPDVLPDPLSSAVARLKAAAREAAERSVESLGLAAMSATQAQQRDNLLAAQFELNRKSATFIAEFNSAFDQRLQRELGLPLALGNTAARSPTSTTTGAPAGAHHGGQVGATPAHTGWDSLHLVEDSEVEAQISAERFGLDIAHTCEWELREIDAYLGGLLSPGEGEVLRNPLRPEVIGHAVIRGTQVVSERTDTRKLLAAELSRSLAGLLRNAYAGIVSDWRQAGLRPAGLMVRNRGPRNQDPERRGSGPTERSRTEANADVATSGYGPGGTVPSGHSGGPYGGRSGSGGGNSSGNPSGRQSPGGRVPFDVGRGAGNSGGELGQIDPALMSVIRRLAFHPDAAGGDSASLGSASVSGNFGGNFSGNIAGSSRGETLSGAAASALLADIGRAPDGGQPMLPNLIHAHRDELRQASRGALDHLVIDVIGFLFDQILADPKVPPQMARLLARLQLPVLRAALGDPSFFSSRRHPVRRFINRLASLSAAFDDYTDPAARAFLAKAARLVNDVVEGDFERADLYEQQLATLESFVAEQSAAELRDIGQAAGAATGHNDQDGTEQGAAGLLAQKEDEQRLHQLYADRLSAELKDLAAPAFLRDFVSRVWSRVLLQAAQRDGGQGALSGRLRQAGRELFLSVMPKSTPALRKSFLAELPRLMQNLTDGMDLVAWPSSQRQAFFDELMPAHAEALKSSGGRTLDANLLAKLVDTTLARPPPSREEVRHAPHLEVLSDAIDAVTFSPEQAKQVGLVDDAAVDWNTPLDIDLDQVSADAEAALAGVQLPGLPELPTASESQTPRQLADQVQVGFAYQMHLEGGWHKVRLTHVSTGRNFFVFTRGSRHRQTLSLTYRMLAKMCETGRLRAIEKASLLERATARARRQLSALASGASASA